MLLITWSSIVIYKKNDVLYIIYMTFILFFNMNPCILVWTACTPFFFLSPHWTTSMSTSSTNHRQHWPLISLSSSKSCNGKLPSMLSFKWKFLYSGSDWNMITFFNNHFNFNHAFIPLLVVACCANNLGVSYPSCLQSQAFIDHLRINFKYFPVSTVCSKNSKPACTHYSLICI